MLDDGIGERQIERAVAEGQAPRVGDDPLETTVGGLGFLQIDDHHPRNDCEKIPVVSRAPDIEHGGVFREAEDCGKMPEAAAAEVTADGRMQAPDAEIAEADGEASP